MAFKVIPELINFISTFTPHRTESRFGGYYWQFLEKANNEATITITSASKQDNWVMFDDDGRVTFSGKMTAREKQSFYSRLKAFVKKAYTCLPTRDYVIYTGDVNVFNLRVREIRIKVRNKKYTVGVVAEKGDYYHIIHDPAVDIGAFVKKAEKIKPESEEDENKDRREHKIDDNFDVVENMSNTDDDNHGGDSIAHQVEDGQSRDDGIIENNDNSATSAPDTADNSAGETTSDGFQEDRGGESGGDSAQEGESHPAGAFASSETADSERSESAGGKGTQEDNGDTQEDFGGEGAPQPLIVEEDEDEDEEDEKGKNGEKGKDTTNENENVIQMIEDFLEEERNFNNSYRGEGLDIDTELSVMGRSLDEGILRALKKVFRNHVKLTTLGRTSPSVDKKLLIKRLVTFQNPYTAFKKDIENQTILILVDTSPSMTNFIHLVPYFWKLTKKMKEIVVIENTNMFPIKIYKNGKMTKADVTQVDIAERDDETAYRFYEDFLRKHDITTIVNFTDFDGIKITKLLLEKTNAEMIILDVYMCRQLGYQPQHLRNNDYLPDELRRFRDRVSYWYGVGDFKGVISVLNEEL